MLSFTPPTHTTLSCTPFSLVISPIRCRRVQSDRLDRPTSCPREASSSCCVLSALVIRPRLSHRGCRSSRPLVSPLSVRCHLSRTAHCGRLSFVPLSSFGSSSLSSASVAISLFPSVSLGLSVCLSSFGVQRAFVKGCRLLLSSSIHPLYPCASVMFLSQCFPPPSLPADQSTP